MTLDQARGIVRNPEMYGDDPDRIRRAVSFVLGSLECTQGDFMEAVVAEDFLARRRERRA